MNLVYYSLAALGSNACERQWVQSIRSLRRFNPTIPVRLFLYGSPSPDTWAEAVRMRVEVTDLGNYSNCFAHLPQGRAAVLETHPTLHKILSLRHLPDAAYDQVLFLDCDTFFFADVEHLFARYHAHHFCAREEPGSRRSHYGYDPACIDEDALFELAMQEGLVPVPPYNTGAMIFNGGLWNQLAALGDEFLDFTWRLLGARGDKGDRLAYPSSNAWIIEEIAFWLTLGRFPSLTHQAFARDDVAQNGEVAGRIAAYRPLLAHYYTAGEAYFFHEVQRL
jgi:hypothetical protein